MYLTVAYELHDVAYHVVVCHGLWVVVTWRLCNTRKVGIFPCTSALGGVDTWYSTSIFPFHSVGSR